MYQQAEIPARQLLLNAMATNQRLGHENLGFLSSEYGFMPSQPPLLRLPAAYAVWDEYGEQLPELYKNLTLRRALDKLPLLSADVAHLPDRFLLRAALLIGYFAHAYYHSTPTPPAALPIAIQQPWTEITNRLGRKAPFLSYTDMVAYNWQLIDPTLKNPRQVDNMRPLIPLWGNETERYFLMTVIDILNCSTPLVEAIVQAQEAVVRNDDPDLLRQLQIITDCIHQLTYTSLAKTDLNAYSRYYVDPVVWGKTIAPFSPAIRPEAPSPAGAATPSLQILDLLFGRQSYASQMGNLMTLARTWYPKHWWDFYHAVQQISVVDYIQRKADSTLTDAYHEALQAYVGETGFLARHRLKIYGYTEISFKVGRTTISGHGHASVAERTWDKVDDELEAGRRERLLDQATNRAPHLYVGKVVAVADSSRSRQAKKVVVDLMGRTVRYQAGDRCAILPENSERLVQKTLQALCAEGHEVIRLDATWQAALKLRTEGQPAAIVSLRELLTYGQLRPVKRATALRLYQRTQSPLLKAIIDARAEQATELWELLVLAAGEGFDPRTLWLTLGHNQPPTTESSLLCQLIPPEEFRLYSISSAMTAAECAAGASRLALTVGQLQYQRATGAGVGPVDAEDPTGLTRYGTASHFLTTALEKPFVLKVSHPPRFHLPTDRKRPIVMFAGGTGIAPFLSFMHERIQAGDSGENWLFLGIRTTDDFYYQDELERFVAQKQLHLRVAFSQQDIRLCRVAANTESSFAFAEGKRQRVEDAILSAENSHQIWSLLRSVTEGGQGAYLYVCGRAGFAKSVMQAVMRLFEHFHPGKGREQRAAFYRLVAEGRYMQDIFTTYTAPHAEQQREIDISEIARHTNAQTGYWVIIDQGVYDVSDFIEMHPGGFHILRNYVGMDATWAYQKVRHHLNPEVQAILAMYKIGNVRPVRFSQSPMQMTAVEHKVQALYAQWVRTLFAVTELENALHTDYAIGEAVTTYDEAQQIDPDSPFKVQSRLQTHKKFSGQLTADVYDTQLYDLWKATVALCGNHPPGSAFPARHNRQQAAAIAAGTHCHKQAFAQLDLVVQQSAAGHAATDRATLVVWCQLFETEDKRVMQEIRSRLGAGIQLFEQYEQHTIEQGGKHLLHLFEEIHAAYATYLDFSIAQTYIAQFPYMRQMAS